MMARTASWKQARREVTIATGPQAEVEADLAQIERACREIAFCELAEAMAHARIVALRGAASGCRAEAEAQPGSHELRLAARSLANELASFEETLPLECAYRADQRDIALARLGGAQARLRERCVEDGAVRTRVQAALALAPGLLVQSARQQAAARLSAL